MSKILKLPTQEYLMKRFKYHINHGRDRDLEVNKESKDVHTGRIDN